MADNNESKHGEPLHLSELAGNIIAYDVHGWGVFEMIGSNHKNEVKAKAIINRVNACAGMSSQDVEIWGDKSWLEKMITVAKKNFAYWKEMAETYEEENTTLKADLAEANAEIAILKNNLEATEQVCEEMRTAYIKRDDECADKWTQLDEAVALLEEQKDGYIGRDITGITMNKVNDFLTKHKGV